MAGSLFRNYPYDVPTEAFSLNLFRQVRAAAERCMGSAARPPTFVEHPAMRACFRGQHRVPQDAHAPVR